MASILVQQEQHQASHPGQPCSLMQAAQMLPANKPVRCTPLLPLQTPLDLQAVALAVDKVILTFDFQSPLVPGTRCRPREVDCISSGTCMFSDEVQSAAAEGQAWPGRRLQK